MVSRDEERALDAIFQLSNISGPLVLEQAPLGGRLEPPRRPFAVNTDEVPRERQDVVRTVRERGQRELDDVQTEVGIFAELAVADRARQIRAPLASRTGRGADPVSLLAVGATPLAPGRP